MNHGLYNFREPYSVDDAKSIVRVAKKYRKRALVELEDAKRNDYSLGVKIHSETVARYDATIAHFERWLKEHA